VDILRLNRSRAESTRDTASAYICDDDSTPLCGDVNKFGVRPPSRYTENRGEQAGFLLAKTNVPAEAGIGPGRERASPATLVKPFRMPRPRKDDTRNHQINIRFTAREFARVHHHAGLLGKTPADFARSVMLRRPRHRKGPVPVMIAIDEPLLRQWHEAGSVLNAVAHGFNATGEISRIDLGRLVRALRRLVEASVPASFLPASGSVSYALAPALRYHLRKTCTNLVQIANRAEALGIRPPLPLFNLIRRFRVILNGDRPPHGA
jgi:hypothetical protein